MARRPRLVAPGLLYHVIARGNQRQPTFLADLDYQAYLMPVWRGRLESSDRIAADVKCLSRNV